MDAEAGRRHTARRPWDGRGRDWSGVAASRGAPRVAGHQQKLADGKEGFSSQLSEGAGPAHGVISDVQPPGC